MCTHVSLTNGSRVYRSLIKDVRGGSALSCTKGVVHVFANK